ncbi:MAG: hypothetical protein GF332_02395 [Candidatus Moranbacteria bacterium]|nr:hypothetical protein [Candidatus Moranbacteria bacterium]
METGDVQKKLRDNFDGHWFELESEREKVEEKKDGLDVEIEEFEELIKYYETEIQKLRELYEKTALNDYVRLSVIVNILPNDKLFEELRNELFFELEVSRTPGNSADDQVKDRKEETVGRKMIFIRHDILKPLGISLFSQESIGKIISRFTGTKLENEKRLDILMKKIQELKSKNNNGANDLEIHKTEKLVKAAEILRNLSYARLAQNWLNDIIGPNLIESVFDDYRKQESMKLRELNRVHIRTDSKLLDLDPEKIKLNKGPDNGANEMLLERFNFLTTFSPLELKAIVNNDVSLANYYVCVFARIAVLFSDQADEALYVVNSENWEETLKLHDTRAKLIKAGAITIRNTDDWKQRLQTLIENINLRLVISKLPQDTKRYDWSKEIEGDKEKWIENTRHAIFKAHPYLYLLMVQCNYQAAKEYLIDWGTGIFYSDKDIGLQVPTTIVQKKKEIFNNNKEALEALFQELTWNEADIEEFNKRKKTKKKKNYKGKQFSLE